MTWERYASEPVGNEKRIKFSALIFCALFAEIRKKGKQSCVVFAIIMGKIYLRRICRRMIWPM